MSSDVQSAGKNATLTSLLRSPQQMRLVAAMVVSVSAIAALALVDQRLESEASLHDYAQEQVRMAKLAGDALRLELEGQRETALDSAQDRPLASSSLGHAAETLAAQLSSRLLAGEESIADARTKAFVLPPGEARLYAHDGPITDTNVLLAAFHNGDSWVRIAGSDAERLGLPSRTAVAGIAATHVRQDGLWKVGIVSSAGRVRDRAKRAQWRFVLSVLSAVGMVGIFGTVALRTQRTQHELERALDLRELRERRAAQLEQESRAATMVTLAAGMAHEVSTPLNVIAGRAEQLLAAEEDERVRRPAQAILDQSHRIREVVRGFLDLARGRPPALQAVSPEAVIGAAAKLVTHRFEAAAVKLTQQSPEPLPAVTGEPRLLEQALVNLLLNACDACKKGGRVGVTASAADGGVRFVVEDDGVGIGPEHAARVLEPFFSTKPHMEGSGLGLAITKEIVAMHRGSLRVEPRPERGTRAEIFVPFAPERVHA